MISPTKVRVHRETISRPGHEAAAVRTPQIDGSIRQRYLSSSGLCAHGHLQRLSRLFKLCATFAPRSGSPKSAFLLKRRENEPPPVRGRKKARVRELLQPLSSRANICLRVCMALMSRRAAPLLARVHSCHLSLDFLPRVCARLRSCCASVLLVWRAARVLLPRGW